ncbi:MAG: ATP cone domain-containing protein [bacterium]|nr:ATP cone domain-containing protein [bacterium]
MVTKSRDPRRLRRLPKQVRKRDGTLVDFDIERIIGAVSRAMKAAGEGKDSDPRFAAHAVAKEVQQLASEDKEWIPTVENIQDIVENELILLNYVKTAKSFILYRQKRAETRQYRGDVPEDVRTLAIESKKHFQNQLAEYVYYSTYSKWIPELGRRETWVETVTRYNDFMRENLGKKLTEAEYAEIYENMLDMKALGSMRLLWSSGPAARESNVTAYNCSYVAPTTWRHFGETLYILACGTGLGFSVERQFVEQLPIIEKQKGKKVKKYIVADSKEGWADAVIFALETIAAGDDVVFDYSQVRPAGARLKTMGGRASGPDPLKSLLNFVRTQLLENQGRRLQPIHVHDIMCMIGEVIVMGGVRRSALISLSDIDDQDMLRAKNGQFWNTHPHRSLSNNSAVYNETPDTKTFLREWLNLVESNSGERGIFNRGGLKTQMPERRWKITGADWWEKMGCNPCLTEDTLVYVADGRGHVTIGELAHEGKDVPVFAYDDTGSLVVRTMRNPRVTGINQPVYTVALDDGSRIRATGNHKFRLKSGEYRTVNELKGGDSLDIITRYKASLKDVLGQTAPGQDYWWVASGQAKNSAEHRAIASFHYNTDIVKGQVVHHRDFNASNNAPSNLEILSKQEHDMIHGRAMRGDNNPMRCATKEWSREKWQEYRMKHSIQNIAEKNSNYGGITNEELQTHALALTQQLGRRFSAAEWSVYAKNNALPQSFSKWRHDHLGGINGFAKWAALLTGVEHIDVDPRTVRLYGELSSQGYDCDIVGGSIQITKKCEVCSEVFTTGRNHRECGVCSSSCATGRMWANPEQKKAQRAALLAGHSKQKESVREIQAKIFTDVTSELGRRPLKDEWIAACKAANVSPEIGRESSPYRTYADLEDASSYYNHRVVSISFDGYETVYNGTVDEFHNFFVGGFAGTTSSGKEKVVYLNNLQCGEIILRPNQFCNLTEVVCRAEDTEKTLMEKVRIATIVGTYQSTLTKFPYLGKEWKKNCEEERLLGVSLTGQWDCPALRNVKTMQKLRQVAIDTNKKYAKRFEVPQSTAITCVKPSGNTSQLTNAASGCHPRYAAYYIRRVRVEAHNPLFAMLKDMGVPHQPEVGQNTQNATTYVLEFPIAAPESALTRNELMAIPHLEYWKMLKEHFTEHNPSVTIQVEDDEWVKVGEWVYSNWDKVGGLTFLPKSDHTYQLAPYEEISKKEYDERAKNFPDIDFSKIVLYEYDDAHIKGAKELACTSGTCEIEIVPGSVGPVAK